jgi:AcrR family transcriptional regulator
VARGKGKDARAVNGDAIPDRILAVATELFIRHGYNGVSFLTIGKELGISHSNIHYHYRTKAVLAEAALKAYASQAKSDFEEIWTSTESDLLTRFIRSRDWIHRRYLTFNPKGAGGQNWGLLARFASEAEAMSPGVRKILRATMDDMDSFVAVGIDLAVERGELSIDTPRNALVLQVSSLLHTSRNITRFAGSFKRLDDLLKWTFEVIQRAYGTKAMDVVWPSTTQSPSG